MEAKAKAEATKAKETSKAEEEKAKEKSPRIFAHPETIQESFRSSVE